MLQKIKEDLEKSIKDNLGYDILVQDSKIDKFDLSISLFKLVSLYKKDLNTIFNEINDVVKKNDYISSIELTGGFLNLNLNHPVFSSLVLNKILKDDNMYGSSKNNKNIVIDYSSPNIAKSFSVGHLRSTVIGNSLKNIYEKLGYKVFGINHLGDWGTQFGNLICAYKMWKDEYDFVNNPLESLQDMYQRFHKDDILTDTLKEKGRIEFKKLEEKIPENIKLWEMFKKISLDDFKKTYAKLNVSFSSYDGEAFYNDKLNLVLDDLNKSNLLIKDDGAMVVRVGNDIPPAIILKSDGASSYILRDLAAIKYRIKTYKPEKIIYVVGSEQKLHFEQLQRIVKLLKYDVEILYVSFGLVLKDGKKMSTRKGTGKNLDDVITDACLAAKKQITEKNPNLSEKDEIASKVGISALIFFNLKNERNLNINFNLDEMLRFDGMSGPYLQYSSVRIRSILKLENKIDLRNIDYNICKNTHYFQIIMELSKYPQIIKKAKDENAPDVVSKYILNLAKLFNSFYQIEKILVDDAKVKNLNLLLIKCINIVLESAMNLLGIFIVDKM